MSASKDAFFFFHDTNARSDHKIIKLLRIHGPAGYGCYWMLIESLRDTSDLSLPLNAVQDLAYNFRVEESLVSSIINDFGLFVIDDQVFYSARLKRSLQSYIAKKEKLSAAGIKGNQKRWGQSPPDSEAIATQSLKEEKRIEEKI